MKTYLNNERGAALLLYILMASLILVIFAPVMFMMSSSATSANKRDMLDKSANLMAVGVLESLVAYLNAYSSGDRPGYFLAYPGWGQKTFQSPDGTTIQVELLQPAVSNNSAIVYAKVSATSGNMTRTKSLGYAFNVSNGTSSQTIDTTNVIQVPANSTSIYTQAGANQSTLPGGMQATTNQTLDAAITGELSQLSTSVTGQITSYQNSVNTTCTNCTEAAQISNAIANSTSNPVIVKATNVNIGSDTTFGSPSKPVVLVVDSLDIGSNLTVYGDIVLLGNMNSSNNFNLTAKSVNGLYGNILVKGAANVQNNGTLNAENIFYADSMNVQNNADVKAKQMIIKNSVSVSNNAALIADNPDNANPTLIIAGSVTAQNNSSISSEGDIFVADTLSVNKGTITASGSIAAEVAQIGDSTVSIGGGYTTLQIVTTSTGGGGTTTGSTWGGSPL
ncbi:hypothetical protein FE783_00155 [Paenibacillus mesophilus]|uniref:hypothetical protein n=1 Tax=Paenibacillus mesophilus TaxID=2582849 RepID=UPI00110D927B|nr:hypothetical protein [Paenibacillus mesophilus]TMV52646.1 hypothetical protein FE783_00155 [Paenibacillus mesophilus]